MSGGSGDRLLALLDMFSEERLEWTAEELMAALEFSRPTLYRHLKLLKEAGFLVALPGRGYTLGPRVVELDFLMRQSDPLVAHGGPMLDGLAEQHPGTALLVRWYGAKLLCVDSRCYVANPVSSYPRGRPMPLARGAISRAILANLPRRQQLAMIGENLAHYAETGLGDSVESVLARLRQDRRDGVTIAFGEVTPGAVGVAAPIFDTGNAPIAALCLTARQADMPRERLPTLAADVRDAAAAVSAALAGRHTHVASGARAAEGAFS